MLTQLGPHQGGTGIRTPGPNRDGDGLPASRLLRHERPITALRVYSPQTLARKRNQFSPIILRILVSGQPSCSIAAVKLGKSPSVRIPVGFTKFSWPIDRAVLTL